MTFSLQGFCSFALTIFISWCEQYKFHRYQNHFQIILKLFFFGNCWTFGSVCRNILCTFLELERNARQHVIGMVFALHVWRIFHLTHDPSLFPDTASSLLRSAASHENLFMSVKLAFLSDIFTSICVVEDVETLREFGIIQKKRNAGPPMIALYLMAFATVILCQIIS